ncbi:DNA primase [Wenjunlia vitaminophila]|uniref:DNA primase n=1 Tax=Wenjunlia vitaminophila TaxID=76728 RepID=A0A0T6LKR3_WENVI|nr:DNA primase [Wenjunlia vitaminophila]KRV46450.1 DNA primase [Wenjunlia vitaminophila]
MAGRIRDEDVKAVRGAVPIDVVVSEYLQLRNAGGGNLKGLCPFHEEKSPSFQVSPSKGLYFCFGCQEGGDTLDFVMKLEHITFAEAVERLAAQAGIALRYEEGGYTPGRQQGERTRLLEAHRVAAAWFVEQLDGPEAEPARRFLSERGFDQAAAQHFGVGYAPGGWENLVRFLRGKGFTERELLTSGLASEGRRGPMDRFRGRLLWPIRDITGEVIGFGARRLRDDDNGPKYLNTPETPIYKKSQVLYGIDLAKREIAKTGRAVVVEGYTDVMACHLAGITTAIATCGTSFGEEHIRILRRLLMDSSEFRGEVVYTFDGDAAGQKAALRAFEGDQKFAARTFIAVGPDGMDPCDLRLARGDGAVRDLVEGRRPLFDFAIRSLVDRYDVETPEGQAAALQAAVPLIARIKDEYVRESYGRQLASMLGVLDERSVIRRVAQLAHWERERRRQGGSAAGPGRRDQGAPARGPSGAPGHGGAPGPQGGRAPQARPSGPRLDLRNPVHMAERELLKLALQTPALVAPAFDAYGEDEFTAPPYAAVCRAVAEAGGTSGADDDYLARVREAAPDDQLRSLVTELAVEPMRTPRQVDAVYAGEQLVAVRLRAVDRRITVVRGQLRRLDPRDAERAAAVTEELWTLQQYAQGLRDRGAAAL